MLMKHQEYETKNTELSKALEAAQEKIDDLEETVEDFEGVHQSYKLL